MSPLGEEDAVREIPTGSCTLRVGDEAGLEIRTQAGAGTLAAGTGAKGRDDLCRAVEQADEEHDKRTAGEVVEGASDKASEVTGKVERAKTLCTEVLNGEVSLQSVGSELDALVGLLGRLDRAGRWEEELRLARCAAKLLALARRWLDLLHWLQAALRAAERLDDDAGKAWAAHELGTLHLAAGKDAAADSLLTQARELRERCGDRHGVALTERNLNVLCRKLRSDLHEKRRERLVDRAMRRPAIAVGAAVVLLAIGGSSGAVIDHSHGKGPTASASKETPGPEPAGHSATVAISFSPLEPRVGKPVTFRVSAADHSDPIVRYRWLFDERDPSQGKVATHTYLRTGTFKVVVLATDAHHKTIGEASASIRVLSGNRPGESPTAKFAFRPASPLVNHPVVFDAGGSPASTGSLTYEWDFADGHTATGRTASNTYTKVGPYDVKLTVTDSKGKTDTGVRVIEVTQGPGQAPTLTLECARPRPSARYVSISGSSSPPQPEAQIQLTITDPSGKRVPPYEATADEVGAFHVNAKTGEEGLWKISAEWDAPGASKPVTKSCEFTVEPEQPSPVTTSTGESEG